jgi:hypothetical protein
MLVQDWGGFASRDGEDCGLLPSLLLREVLRRSPKTAASTASSTFAFGTRRQRKAARPLKGDSSRQSHSGVAPENPPYQPNMPPGALPDCYQIVVTGSEVENKKSRNFLRLFDFCLARTTGLEPATTGSTVYQAS